MSSSSRISIDEPIRRYCCEPVKYAALQKARQDQGIRLNNNSQLEALQLRIKKATTEINDAEIILQNLINEAKCEHN